MLPKPPSAAKGLGGGVAEVVGFGVGVDEVALVPMAVEGVLVEAAGATPLT